MASPDPPSTPGLPVPAAAGPASNYTPAPPFVLLQATQSTRIPATPLPPYVPAPPPPEPLP